MEWISVKDGLPDNKVDVIIYGKNNNGKMRVLYGHRVWKYWTAVEFWGSYTCFGVTHWAKLPDPPSRGEEREMKIYAITKGEYSDYHICALTTDLNRAKKIQKLCSDSVYEAEIEQYEDAEIQEHRQMWFYSEEHPDNYMYPEQIEKTPDVSEKVIQWGTGFYAATCYAEDAEHAKKKAQDMIAKHKAELLGL